MGDKALGEALRRLRSEQGLSLREVARQVGIGASMLSQIETGSKGTSTKRLRRLAKVLGVSVGDLFDSKNGQANRRAG